MNYFNLNVITHLKQIKSNIQLDVVPLINELIIPNNNHNTHLSIPIKLKLKNGNSIKIKFYNCSVQLIGILRVLSYKLGKWEEIPIVFSELIHIKSIVMNENESKEWDVELSISCNIPFSLKMERVQLNYSFQAKLNRLPNVSFLIVDHPFIVKDYSEQSLVNLRHWLDPFEFGELEHSCLKFSLAGPKRCFHKDEVIRLNLNFQYEQCQIISIEVSLVQLFTITQCLSSIPLPPDWLTLSMHSISSCEINGNRKISQLIELRVKDNRSNTIQTILPSSTNCHFQIYHYIQIKVKYEDRSGKEMNYDNQFPIKIIMLNSNLMMNGMDIEDYDSAYEEDELPHYNHQLIEFEGCDNNSLPPSY